MKFYLFLFGLLFSLVVNAQLVGTKTIKTTGGDYASFKAAFQALNSQGVGVGGVVFIVDDGFTSSEVLPTLGVKPIAPGTASNPILFKKSSSGLNPKITQSDGQTGNSDAVIKIQGAGSQFITFDGIDLQGANDGSTENGLVIQNVSATVGISNITFKNASITLNKNNPNSVIGILIFDAAAPTQASGNCSNNTISNVTIKNVQEGIFLRGNSAAYPMSDIKVDGCVIGDAATPDDIGSSTVPAYGIFGIYGLLVKDLTLSNNTIQNITSNISGGGQIAGVNVSAYGTNNNIFGNIVRNINNANTANTNTVYGVRIEATVSAIVSVYNNVVFGLNTNVAGGTVNGFGANISGSSTGNVNVYFNSILLALPDASKGSAFISSSGSLNFQNNILANLSAATSANSNKKYAVSINSPTYVSNFNVLYIDGTQAGNYTASRAGDWKTLANWKASATRPDSNSFGLNPGFISSTNLKPSIGKFLAGTPISGITIDIDGKTRFATPSIGAYESDVPLPVKLVSFTANKIGELVKLDWTTAKELNHKYFEVAYSINGKDWIVFGIVNNALSTSKDGLRNYSYTHNIVSLKETVVYYRLKQVDVNGEFDYSKIISVSIKNPIELSIYPNPIINSTLHFSLNEAKSNVLSYRIISVLGKTVQVGSIGVDQHYIQLNNLSKGTYRLVFDNGQQSLFVINN